jgi:DNA-binding transcriptional MerR regulator
MIEKTPNKHQESITTTIQNQITTPDARVIGGLPGAKEGKAALVEFELGHMDFVEEQQAFDFGAEFAEAPPTVAMLDKSDLPEELGEKLGSQFSVVEEENTPTLNGDTNAQLDFDEAAKAILAEEAIKAGALEEIELPKNSFANVALPHAQIETDAELVREITAIPQQMAFKIGDVADIVGVKQYVLRYWESEFEALKPRKSKNGQRVYTRKDVEIALMIKKLLYKDRFSIEGARNALRSLKGKVREDKQWNTLITNQETVKEGIRDLLNEIRRFRTLMS